MDIGKEQKTIRVEPAVVPVPQRERTAPGRERRFEPNKPRKPVQDPAKTPTKVPSR